MYTCYLVPYIFKSLFAKDAYKIDEKTNEKLPVKIEFDDLCVTKAVTTSLYLDMNERLDDVTEFEKELKKLLKEENPDPIKVAELEGIISQGHNYIFVGKIGQFCPIKKGCGGGELVSARENKFYSVNGTKGFRFLESETVKKLKKENDIDESYFVGMTNESIEHISAFGNFDWFVNNTPYDGTMPFE